MNELYDLREKLTKELKEYGRKEMSAGTLDVVDKLTHTLKNLDKILDADDYSGYYPYRSYARKRDSMGRYSRNDFTDKLHEMMENAPDEHTRMEIRHLIDKM